MARIAINPRMYMLRRQFGDPTNGVRGRQNSAFFGFYSRQPLPTDPVGTVSVSFSGVKVGSEIKLFNADKALLDGTESSGVLPAFTMQRYAPGSQYNNVRILIMNLGYEVIDIPYELPSVNTTIPVFQRIDRNYRNPV